MQCLNLLGFQIQVLLEPLTEKLQSFHALRKDNKAIISFLRMPIEFAAWTEQFEQSLVSAEALWPDRLHSRRKLFEYLAVAFSFRGLNPRQLLQTVGNGRATR